MKTNPMAWVLLVFTLSLAGSAWAQAPGVPIVRQGHGPIPDPQLVEEAKKMRDAAQLLSLENVREQNGRTSCRLALPPPRKRSLSASQLWSLARKAHLRVGYLYFCDKCKKLHLNLAGGYALTADGAVATCYHVVLEPNYCVQGHLVAVTEAGKVAPVTEVLACDKSADVCIVRVRSASPLEPLALNTNIAPGDEVWCYSDPAGQTGFFTHGIVNRFYQDWDFEQAKPKSPKRMNVSTDWAPGSSGAAVLDRFGNAVGHVWWISARDADSPSEPRTATNHVGQTVIVFHDAVCAADVIGLVKR